MTDIDDTGLFSFDEPSSLSPYLDAIRSVGYVASRTSEQNARRIRALALEEVLEELEPCDRCTLMFHAGRQIGLTDPAAGWAGFADTASRLLVRRPGPVALRTYHQAGSVRCRWELAAPAALTEGIVYGLDRVQGLLHAWRSEEVFFQEAWAVSGALQGMDGGRLYCFEPPPPCSPPVELEQAAILAFADAHASLLAGLLAGACESAARHALAYAQDRVSAGKPIAQHQAVALRLAEMGIQQAGLSLQFERVSAAAAWHASAHVAASGVTTAVAIVRDALQTAAAHGYVAGLPFRRLHEQVHTLGCLLNMWRACLEPEPSPEEIA